MKPIWKDAPEWAKYLAMDYDGEWWWFERKPLWCVAGHWHNGGKMEVAIPDNRCAETSLEKRP